MLDIFLRGRLLPLFRQKCISFNKFLSRCFRETRDFLNLLNLGFKVTLFSQICGQILAENPNKEDQRCGKDQPVLKKMVEHELHSQKRTNLQGNASNSPSRIA